MPHYLCRFIDEAGRTKGDLPLVASSESDAISLARALFHRRRETGGFEVWLDSRRISQETPKPPEGAG